MTSYTYLLVNLGAVIIPLLFSFHPRLRFWDNIQPFVYANLITSVIFIAWDAAFTGLGVWGFNERYLTGLFVANLPIEEILFFICIPYACVFSFHCFEVLMNKFFSPNLVKGLTVFVCSFSVLGLVLFSDRLYPAFTFLLLAGFLIYLQFVYKPEWLGQFYFTYLVMLIPFFIVNGILTGSGLQEPVVWYNPSEIMNIKMLTIPLEDVFYGMLLIGVNVFLYKYFLTAKTNAEVAGLRPSQYLRSGS